MWVMSQCKLKEQPSREGEQQANPCAACVVRDMTFCSALAEDETAHLQSIFNTIQLNKRATIFDEGERAEYVFNVIDGAAKVYKLLPDGRRQITGFLFAGDFLGIATNEKYAYSAEAVGNVTLCRFSRRKLEALLDKFPKLEKRLLGMASNELVLAQDHILLLGRKSAQEKVASFLLSLSDRAIKREGIASPISVPMSREDIADYLGLATETVSRTITIMKRDGYIRLLPGGTIEISDLEAL